LQLWLRPSWQKEEMAQSCSACDWIQLQKHIKITNLLCSHGRLYSDQDDTQSLLGTLKTQAKDYFFNRLSVQSRWQPRLHPSTQPALSENSMFVFCPGSHDAHRFLNEFIFMLRNEPQVFQTVLRLWPRDSVHLPIAIESFANLFFEEVVSPENYEYELLQAIGHVIDLGEHLEAGGMLAGDSVLGGFLRCYMRRRTVEQYWRGVYEGPLLEVIYNMPTELAFASDKIASSLKSYREEFLKPGNNYRRRVSEPMLLTRGLGSSTDISTNPFASIPEEPEDPENDESVNAVLMDLSERLENVCLLVLNSLFSKIDEMPYGLRWICKAVYSSCTRAEWTEEKAATLIGTLLFPGWDFYLDMLDLSHIAALSPVSRTNLGISETTLRNVFSRQLFGSPDLKHVNTFLQSQHTRYLTHLRRIINTPDFQALAFTLHPQTPSPDLSRPSQLSILNLLDSHRTVGPESNAIVENFHFQACVFPLAAIHELINMVLGNREKFAEGVLEQFYLAAEDIARCFQGPGNSFLEVQELQIQEIGLEREFDCVPFLIFFLDNSDTIATGKVQKRRIQANGNSSDIVKKVTRALIRLLAAIEQIPTLLANAPLPELISQVQLQSYLFQSKKASIQQSISARTVANYLIAYLPSIEEEYKNSDFEKLYRRTVEKTSRMREKNRTHQILNQVIMLGTRTVEGLLKAESGDFVRQRGLLRDLKELALGLSVPICLRVHELADGDACLAVNREKCMKNSGLKGSFSGFSANLSDQKGHFCAKIAEFVQVFAGISQVQNSTQSLSDFGNVRSCFSSYLEIVKDEIRSTVENCDINEVLLDELMACLEDHITRKLHGDVFPSWASKEDISLYSKSKSLQTAISPLYALLGFEPDTEIAQQCKFLLDQLPIRMTPREKMLLLVEFASLTLSEFDLAYELSSNSRPDLAVKCLALGVLKYMGGRETVPHLLSSLNYIYKFGTHRKPSQAEIVTFSLVKSAVEWVMRGMEGADQGIYSRYI